jgi:hypothetical protein
MLEPSDVRCAATVAAMVDLRDLDFHVTSSQSVNQSPVFSLAQRRRCLSLPPDVEMGG